MKPSAPMYRILIFLTLVFAGTAVAQKNETAFGSIIYHADGRRTERQKMGGSDQWREVTYNKNNVCETARVYWLDKQGRLMRGEIYDGKGNLKATTWYIYDKKTGQRVEERMFSAHNPKRPIRRLFYPGVFKDPRYANRITAFTYDPDDPEARPREVTDRKIRTYEPISESNKDDFEPGVPTGRSGTAPAVPSVAPPPMENPAANRTQGAASGGGKGSADRPAKRSFLLPQRQRKP